MVNKIIIQGRLTKDPELKASQSGVPKLLFTVAWSEKYKEVERRCFMLCEAWRQSAEFISRYFRKGQEIMIEGHMVTEEWKEKESTTFCQVDRVHFCGPKQERTEEQKPDADGFLNVKPGLDEELPFT